MLNNPGTDVRSILVRHRKDSASQPLALEALKIRKFGFPQKTLFVDTYRNTLDAIINAVS